MSRLSLITDAALDPFGRDRGSGTVLPTTDLTRGDVYFHTDRGLFVYTGVAWRQDRPHELTKTQRTALDTTGLHAGYQVYETDTDRTWQWSGAKWRYVGGGAAPFIKVRRTATWTSGTSGWQPFPWQSVAQAGTAGEDTTDASMWNVAQPSRLVAPIDGLYLVEAAVGFPSAVSAFLGFVRNSDSVVYRKMSGYSAGAPVPELLAVEPMRLAAGQYVEAVIYAATAIVMPNFPAEVQPSMSLLWIGNY